MVVKRSRFVAAEDRTAALPLILASMAGHLALHGQLAARREQEGERAAGGGTGSRETVVDGPWVDGGGTTLGVNPSAILEPRAVVRLAETFGVDFADVASYMESTIQSRDNTSAAAVDSEASDAALATTSLVETYVEALLQEARYVPAVSMVLHFNLRRFAAPEVLAALVASQHFALASTLAAAVAPDRPLRSELVEVTPNYQP